MPLISKLLVLVPVPLRERKNKGKHPSSWLNLYRYRLFYFGVIIVLSSLFHIFEVLKYDSHSISDELLTPVKLGNPSKISDRYLTIPAAEHEKLSSDDATQWPPTTIIDKLVDRHNSIAVFILNCGYADLADNLIASLIQLKVTNFVIVPLDETIYKLFGQLYPENTIPPMPDLKLDYGELAHYGSAQFKAVTSSRATIITRFLQAGYTAFYCDLDTVWRTNALDYLYESLAFKNNKKNNETSSLSDPNSSNVPIADQKDYEATLVKDSKKRYCSCYIYMKPTSKNLMFLEEWDKEIKTGKHLHDQVAFNAAFQRVGKHLSFRSFSQDSSAFPNGGTYFEKWNGNETMRSNVVIVHNNGITGGTKKLKRFKEFNLWNPSGNLNKFAFDCKEQTVKPEQKQVL